MLYTGSDERYGSKLSSFIAYGCVWCRSGLYWHVPDCRSKWWFLRSMRFVLNFRLHLALWIYCTHHKLSRKVLLSQLAKCLRCGARWMPTRTDPWGSSGCCCLVCGLSTAPKHWQTLSTSSPELLDRKRLWPLCCRRMSAMQAAAGVGKQNCFTMLVGVFRCFI